MIRTLLGTTALLSLLFVMPAQAAETVCSPGLTLPQLKISGQTSFNAWFFNNDQIYKWGNAENTIQDRQFFGRGQLFSVDSSRLRFNVDGKTDRGMDYGLTIVLDGNVDATKTVREDYLYFGGSWGKIYLGDTFGVEGTMAFGGFDQWGGVGFLDSASYDKIINYTFGTVHSIDLVGDTSRDTKVTYVTPRWKGMQLGVSFTPTAHRGEQSINFRTSQKSTKEPFTSDNVAGGFNFIHEFSNGLEMALSATGVTAKTRPEFATAPERYNTGSYAFGATFEYKDIGLSAEYGNNGKSQVIKYLTPTTTEKRKSGANAGQFLDFGISYGIGATKLSAGYYYGWRKALGAANLTNITTIQNTPILQTAKTSAVTAAVDHKLAPGLGVYFEYANFQMKNPAAQAEARRISQQTGIFQAPTTNNRANSFVVGSRLVF